jgi:hypothetical protein
MATPRRPVAWLSILALSIVVLGLVPTTSAHGASARSSAPGTRATFSTTQQFTGRDIYSSDVHPNPSGRGYLMWYSGWQTQQTYDLWQFDTIYQRSAPTPNGPWSDPTTDLISAQVAPQISEVGDPSVSIVPANGGYQYTMFFTALACHLALSCATTQQFGAYSQIWSATSTDGNHWG